MPVLLGGQLTSSTMCSIGRGSPGRRSPGRQPRSPSHFMCPSPTARKRSAAPPQASRHKSSLRLAWSGTGYNEQPRPRWQKRGGACSKSCARPADQTSQPDVCRLRRRDGPALLTWGFATSCRGRPPTGGQLPASHGNGRRGGSVPIIKCLCARTGAWRKFRVGNAQALPYVDCSIDASGHGACY